MSTHLHLPSATNQTLQIQAKILHQIRAFFSARKVLEVQTPLICQHTVTDPYIQSIPVIIANKPQPYYLQTSPEYAMKRLLSAGSGSIYQITKAFRQGDIGRLHNPEFTLLEWYRVDFDHHQLIAEVAALLQEILTTENFTKKTYAEIFQQFLRINPHITSLAELENCAAEHKISLASPMEDCNTGLDVLFTHCIEPHIGQDQPCCIYDFPISKAALARIQSTTPPVASRFEFYYKGMELANGFHELGDAKEQRMRFEKNNLERKRLGLAEMPIDEFFLSALQTGFPDCAGVALGLDRLWMLATQSNNIADVLTFDFSRV